MGLLTLLKRAEEQERQPRPTVVGPTDPWEDAERRIRRSMRMHPRPVSPAQRVSSSTAISSDMAQQPK